MLAAAGDYGRAAVLSLFSAPLRSFPILVAAPRLLPGSSELSFFAAIPLSRAYSGSSTTSASRGVFFSFFRGASSPSVSRFGMRLNAIRIGAEFSAVCAPPK